MCCNGAPFGGFCAQDCRKLKGSCRDYCGGGGRTLLRRTRDGTWPGAPCAQRMLPVTLLLDWSWRLPIAQASLKDIAHRMGHQGRHRAASYFFSCQTGALPKTQCSSAPCLRRAGDWKGTDERGSAVRVMVLTPVAHADGGLRCSGSEAWASRLRRVSTHAGQVQARSAPVMEETRGRLFARLNRTCEAPSAQSGTPGQSVATTGCTALKRR